MSPSIEDRVCPEKQEDKERWTWRTWIQFCPICQDVRSITEWLPSGQLQCNTCGNRRNRDKEV